jgi:signal transduction histidine kinase
MIRGFEEQGFVKLEISDNGLGIDLQRFKQDLFKLYKRFHTHVEGKGLGLYLVKSQLQALGGKLEVKSKVGEGTTFFVFFKK